VRWKATIDTSQFWRLIEQSKTVSGGDCDEQIDALTSSLLELPTEEIEEFDVIFYRFHAKRTGMTCGPPPIL
jgi:uncharacterized protein DUF4240